MSVFQALVGKTLPYWCSPSQPARIVRAGPYVGAYPGELCAWVDLLCTRDGDRTRVVPSVLTHDEVARLTSSPAPQEIPTMRPCPDFLAAHAADYAAAYERTKSRIAASSFETVRDIFNHEHPPGTGWPRDTTPESMARELGAWEAICDSSRERMDQARVALRTAEAAMNAAGDAYIRAASPPPHAGRQNRRRAFAPPPLTQETPPCNSTCAKRPC